MKKKILLLVLSTFIIKGCPDGTSYLGGKIEFCPSVEEECFMNMLNDSQQYKIISDTLTNCSIINQAIIGTPDLSSLLNSAPTIVEKIVESYFLNQGRSGCDSIVNTYLDYSSSCTQSMMWQCSNVLGRGVCEMLIQGLGGIVKTGRDIMRGFQAVGGGFENFGRAFSSIF